MVIWHIIWARSTITADSSINSYIRVEHYRREIRRALIMCIPYVVIIFFLDNLDKLLYSIHSRLGNPLLALYMFLATVIILALLIRAILDLKNDYKAVGYRAYLPIIIYSIALLNSFWSPLRISSEIFQHKIVHRAFRKEHYGHAQMKMREDGKIDIRYPGPFGMADWEYGRWSGRGDTFYLDYDRGSDTIATRPDTLVMARDGLLAPLGIPADTLRLYQDRFFRMSIDRRRVKY